MKSFTPSSVSSVARSITLQVSILDVARAFEQKLGAAPPPTTTDFVTLPGTNYRASRYLGDAVTSRTSGATLAAACDESAQDAGAGFPVCGDDDDDDGVATSGVDEFDRRTRDALATTRRPEAAAKYLMLNAIKARLDAEIAELRQTTDAETLAAVDETVAQLRQTARSRSAAAADAATELIRTHSRRHACTQRSRL